MTTASLHVVTSDARRGAETFAVDLAAALREMGHHAQVVALSPSGTGQAHAMPVLGGRRRGADTFRALRRAARDADVVVAHGSATLEACAVGLAGTGVPFVYRTIGDPSYWVRPGWRRQTVGWMLRRAARNVVLWPAAGDHLSLAYAIPRDDIEVIPNGVVVERFPVKDVVERHRTRQQFGVPADQPCLAFVGALSPEKDVTSLLQAVGAFGHAHLLVAGDGPERAELETRSDELAPGRVHYLGAISDPREVYVAADLLALPSLSEGMPAVIIEAGLVGTPTIASWVGAVPEMIDDAETGFLVPPGRPDVLAAVVAEALPYAEDVGHRARSAFARRYTIDAVAPQWASVLEGAAR